MYHIDLRLANPLLDWTLRLYFCPPWYTSLTRTSAAPLSLLMDGHTSSSARICVATNLEVHVVPELIHLATSCVLTGVVRSSTQPCPTTRKTCQMIITGRPSQWRHVLGVLGPSITHPTASACKRPPTPPDRSHTTFNTEARRVPSCRCKPSSTIQFQFSEDCAICPADDKHAVECVVRKMSASAILWGY